MACELFFWTGDYVWNIFDLLVTAAGVVDSLMEVMTSSKGSGASVCRLFRIMRIMRLFRAMKFLKEVEVVLITAGKATFKLSILVSLVVFVSAIVVTNLLWDSPDQEVAAQFRNLNASMWSMFVLMTLDNWTPRSARVLSVMPSMKIFYVLFVFCASIALMSLVPAIFIELHMTAREREEEKVADRKKRLVKKQDRLMLKRLFNICDLDKSGRVSVREMQSVVDDDDLIRKLQLEGFAKKGDMRDVKYGVFDLWNHFLEDTGNLEATISREEFIDMVLSARTDITDTHLWRCITAAHVEAHDLADFVKTKSQEVAAASASANEAYQQVAAMQEEVSNLRCSIKAVQSELEHIAAAAATTAVDAASGKWFHALENLTAKQDDAEQIAQTAAAAAVDAANAKWLQALEHVTARLGALTKSKEESKQAQDPSEGVLIKSNEESKRAQDPSETVDPQDLIVQDRSGSSDTDKDHMKDDMNVIKVDENDADKNNIDKKNYDESKLHEAHPGKSSADECTLEKNTEEESEKQDKPEALIHSPDALTTTGESKHCQ